MSVVNPYHGTVAVPAADIATANQHASVIAPSAGAHQTFGRAWISTDGGLTKTHSIADFRCNHGRYQAINSAVASVPWAQVWWGADSFEQCLAALGATRWVAPE